ncbi:hypothetical protein PCC7424_5882 (plasmid) [Gloeothece citriformis PCC 7424]|uniref:Uncharacterized protein n=1 Tax=Gloeothece citriformis (strain PCC 7424) TaxID=65393 RepID=B7KMA7_GLOC7|nr:hypothetical protein PCC7424_5882 [Gloeothece citriformis PCC 7424]
MWFLKKSPIYLIYPEILQAFDHSNVIEKTEVLKILNFPHSSFIILFPFRSLQNSDQTYLLSATVETFDFNTPSDFRVTNPNLNLYKTKGIIKSLSWVGFNNKEDIFVCSFRYQRRWFSF